METSDIKRRIWLNSIASYIRLIVSLLLSAVTFSIVWRALGGKDSEELGFWFLLWSFMPYGGLMDFGLGVAVQKRVAELSALKDWNQLSRVLSTVFTFYLASAAVICAVAWPIATIVMKVNLFHISPANIEYFRNIMIIFICFVGISFPLGIFPGIIYGLQRMFVYHVVCTITQVTSLVLIIVAVHYHHGGLEMIFMISLICTLAPNLVIGIAAMRALPHVKITPRLFSWATVRETMRFSIFAYVGGTLTNMILNQTDRLVIGATLGTVKVTVYQAGAVVANMFSNFTWQLPVALQPAVAHLHAKQEGAMLRELLIGSCRVNAMIATPLYLLCAFFVEGVMAFLTGDHNLGPEVFWTAQVLLLWGYTSCLTHGVTKPVFLMCGHERRLMWLSVIEAIANLALSLILVRVFQKVFAVAVGSLIPSLIIGWGFLWRWAARDAGVRSIELVRKILVRTWLANLPLLAFGCLCRWQPAAQFDFRQKTWWFFIEGGTAAVIGAACTWLWGMKPEERARMRTARNNFFGKMRTGFASRAAR